MGLATAVNGYSQEFETEADMVGLGLMDIDNLQRLMYTIIMILVKNGWNT